MVWMWLQAAQWLRTRSRRRWKSNKSVSCNARCVKWRTPLTAPFVSRISAQWLSCAVTLPVRTVHNRSRFATCVESQSPNASTSSHESLGRLLYVASLSRTWQKLQLISFLKLEPSNRGQTAKLLEDTEETSEEPSGDFQWYNLKLQINGFVQERRSSIANALELCLSCTNSLKYAHGFVSLWFGLVTWIILIMYYINTIIDSSWWNFYLFGQILHSRFSNFSGTISSVPINSWAVYVFIFCYFIVLIWSR